MRPSPPSPERLHASAPSAIRPGGARATRRALLAAAALRPGAARAETAWPERPVRLVIPFGAGGPIDTIGRLLAERLREALGQAFLIDNRPGAGGSIGIRAVITAPPDGSVLLLTSASLASLPALYPGQELDPRRWLAPVSLVAEVPTALVVRAEAPFRDVAALIAAARARPGVLTYGSGGVGSSNHLSGALFATAAGVELSHISYRGAAPAMTALHAGEIDMVFASTVETLPHAQAGRVRLLGVATERRVAALPEIPAIGEILPGYLALNWYAIAAPRDTPPAILARLAEVLGRLRDLPEIRARFAAAGTVPLLTGPRELAAVLGTEVPKWARVVAEAGIRIE